MFFIIKGYSASLINTDGNKTSGENVSGLYVVIVGTGSGAFATAISGLEQGLTQHAAPDLQQLAKNQFVAKLHSKRRHLTDEQNDKFEVIVGKSPAEFAQELKDMPLYKVAEWFTNHPGMDELLDEKLTKSLTFAMAMVMVKNQKIIYRPSTILSTPIAID